MFGSGRSFVPTMMGKRTLLMSIIKNLDFILMVTCAEVGVWKFYDSMLNVEEHWVSTNGFVSIFHGLSQFDRL